MAATILNPNGGSSDYYLAIDGSTTYPVDCGAQHSTGVAARRFMCSTSGTLNVKRLDGTAVSIGVTAGQIYDIQMAEVTSRVNAIGVLCW